MDEFVIDIAGMKPLHLQVYFLRNMQDFGGTGVTGYRALQAVTTCVIRKRNLILGVGVSIQHPSDYADRDTGNREAFKKAAQNAGWQIVWKMPGSARATFSGKEAMWKILYSAWRKARRIAAEKEKEQATE